jgi:hypothetical protein
MPLHMNTHELADTMERCALALRKLPPMPTHNRKPMLEGDFAVGAALFWSYLRDCMTGTPKESFTRDELLVLLETMSRDGEMFPAGVIELIANCEVD